MAMNVSRREDLLTVDLSTSREFRRLLSAARWRFHDPHIAVCGFPIADTVGARD
jgi:hypothetical protein